MANPRRQITHLGIGYRAITMFADAVTIVYSAAAVDGSASAGLACGCLAGTEDAVELVVAGQTILGKLVHVEPDGACAVQIEGGCELPQGTGTAVARGGKIEGGLSTAAKGYIQAPAATVAGALAARHTVLKIADTTKVQVYLGQ